MAMERAAAADALMEELAAGGWLTDAWREAFAAVPRELFVPTTVWEHVDGELRRVARDTDPDRWWGLVRADVPIVTQVDDGVVGTRPRRATSSCSMPRLVALMLDRLEVADGTRVLEIGSGTGWNAALLAARLGDEQVVSIEVDPQVAEDARTALRRAGRAPQVVTGEGADGWSAGAPYDRTIATCAIGRVPSAWLAQTRPGGLILTPWATAFHNGVLVRLTVNADGTASGGVVGDDVVFMWLRGQRPADHDVMHYVDAADGPAAASRTRLDPRAVASACDQDAAFAIGLRVPTCRHLVGWGTGAASEECTVWLADPVTGSWASATYIPCQDAYDVDEYGPRQLWQEVEAAWTWWDSLGRPARTRFGLTARPDRTDVWLDSPDHLVVGADPRY